MLLSSRSCLCRNGQILHDVSVLVLQAGAIGHVAPAVAVLVAQVTHSDAVDAVAGVMAVAVLVEGISGLYLLLLLPVWAEALGEEAAHGRWLLHLHFLVRLGFSRQPEQKLNRVQV